IRSVSTTRSHRLGGTPHPSRLPDPRGTTASSCSAATRSTAAASDVLPGDATNAGTTRRASPAPRAPPPSPAPPAPATSPSAPPPTVSPAPPSRTSPHAAASAFPTTARSALTAASRGVNPLFVCVPHPQKVHIGREHVRDAYKANRSGWCGQRKD